MAAEAAPPFHPEASEVVSSAAEAVPSASDIHRHHTVNTSGLPPQDIHQTTLTPTTHIYGNSLLKKQLRAHHPWHSRPPARGQQPDHL